MHWEQDGDDNGSSVLWVFSYFKYLSQVESIFSLQKYFTCDPLQTGTAVLQSLSHCLPSRSSQRSRCLQAHS